MFKKTIIDSMIQCAAILEEEGTDEDADELQNLILEALNSPSEKWEMGDQEYLEGLKDEDLLRPQVSSDFNSPEELKYLLESSGANVID